MCLFLQVTQCKMHREACVFLIEETQCFSTDLPIVAKGAKCMFALNLKVIFHLHPATEGWILDIPSKHIYGEGRWGTLTYAYLNMMVISGKCKFKFLYFKRALFISLTLIPLRVSTGIWILKSFNPNAEY